MIKEKDVCLISTKIPLNPLETAGGEAAGSHQIETKNRELNNPDEKVILTRGHAPLLPFIWMIQPTYDKPILSVKTHYRS